MAFVYLSEKSNSNNNIFSNPGFLFRNSNIPKNGSDIPAVGTYE